MTRVEAIERIHKMFAYMESLDADEEEQLDLDALRFAMTDMKILLAVSFESRMTPQKVKWSEIEFPYSPNRPAANCPNCKRKLRCVHTKDNYCPKCGQALEWSRE